MILPSEYHREVTKIQPSQAWGGFSIPCAPKEKLLKPPFAMLGRCIRKGLLGRVSSSLSQLSWKIWMQEYSLQKKKAGCH